MVDNKRKPLPIGKNDFYEIRSNDYFYIDKTHLISTLIDDVCPSAAVLFNRPRHFGKTLALNMLRCFFDCNEKEKNRPLFEGLAVSKSERYMAQQGKYPVIYLNLKDVKGDTKESLEESMKEALKKAIEPFAYLQNSDKIDSFLKKYLLREAFDFSASLTTLSYSLKSLCQLLEKHHGEPPVILVDEYDTPLQSAYLHGFYKSIGDYFDYLFGLTMKGNEYLRLGVIAGALRFPKPGIMSGFNSVIVDNLLSHRYADCFGFTQAEVENMANEYGVPDKATEIQEWYGGYRYDEKEIYNPWSVLRYFDEGCKPQVYWPDSSSPDLATDLIMEDLRSICTSDPDGIQKLCEGGYALTTADPSASYDSFKSGSSHNIYNQMMVCGYLTPKESISWRTYRLTIPNQEMRTIIEKELRTAVANQSKRTGRRKK